MAVAPPSRETPFIEGSGTSFTTEPPDDFAYWDTVTAWCMNAWLQKTVLLPT